MGGLKSGIGKSIGVWGLLPRKFSSYARFRNHERLFRKPFPRIHPMLVVIEADREKKS